MMKKIFSVHTLLFLCIIFLASFFRFYNINWDKGYHLHPDERFLTMVGNSMTLPRTFSDYLNPTTSLMNPANINFRFFVYGIFPLVLNKTVAVFAHTDNYSDFTIQGRTLSGMFDIFTLIFVYKTLRLFEKRYSFSKNVSLLGTFFYAIAVLPIQLSHFFAVDTFLEFFSFASCYFILRYSLYEKFYDVFLSAFFLGLALACKVSAIFILPLILVLFFLPLPTHHLSLNLEKKKVQFENKALGKHFLIFFLLLFSFFILLYTTIRIADPYLFETSNVFHPQVSSLFLQNIKELKSWEGKDVSFPPAIQWINKPPVIFSLVNLSLFGFGILPFIFMLIGTTVIPKKWNTPQFMIIWVWVICFFLYQSTQFVKSIRYLLFLYPFLSLFAGIGCSYILKHTPTFLKVIILVFSLIWPLAFFSIYLHPTTRITASKWMYENIPSGTLVLTEHWDDPLPLLLPQYSGKTIPGEQLPVFDPDSPEKFEQMNALMKKSKYIILSSNRGWGSISTVPEKYPKMTEFYAKLLGGKTNYQLLKEFSSYPSLSYLGLPIDFPDTYSEEAFTVYDHPTVMIFKRF